ncbi:hypothetical protein E4T56_gene16203 [Termitomyces sp. T112]|nr:hypothetical protein C0989_005871 [Termitomyces sp. Mn162]KAG5716769.1 hypothetical protein E4T56_gene16203 [Termitomyces sp. T112]KAH0589387.1 hypothetical protein H2248_005145 [Termitomyces sp. 'cryptogamus']KNZ80479.1 hypothetical protein J132_05599 [Termitomyces sp. J132]
MTNPSHILIARNSRGPNNPSASLSSPTETHAAASGIFRSSGSPPWILQECETSDIVSELSLGEDGEEAIEIDEAFTKNSRFPGTVKIVVENTTFWAHKEVLFFASPFFEAALSGNWLETGPGRPPSMSSVITISQPPSVLGDRTKSMTDASTEMTFAPIGPDIESLELDVIAEQTSPVRDGEDGNFQNADSSESDVVAPLLDQVARARDNSLAKLQGLDEKREGSRQRKGSLEPSHPRRPPLVPVPDAVIVLKEERASTFHDFLKFVYPHLECTITWNNVESLMNISHKLCVPPLQRECLTFLLTHAAGKPIKALRIAELFEEEELYREASRFVLDNPGGWPDEEMATLSQETLLKLEKRRTWFLERVLKLGLTMIAKEYQCCVTCPDPPMCARLLEEKWKQAYFAVFRFGPPQPSMVFRYLRMLEGVSPPLSLTQTACQASAKAFTATLFDRMFSLGVRGSGADTAPLVGRSAAAVAGAATGPRRHFLFCSFRSDAAPKSRRSREGS